MMRGLSFKSDGSQKGNVADASTKLLERARKAREEAKEEPAAQARGRAPPRPIRGEEDDAPSQPAMTPVSPSPARSCTSLGGGRFPHPIIHSIDPDGRADAGDIARTPLSSSVRSQSGRFAPPFGGGIPPLAPGPLGRRMTGAANATRCALRISSSSTPQIPSLLPVGGRPGLGRSESEPANIAISATSALDNAHDSGIGNPGALGIGGSPRLSTADRRDAGPLSSQLPSLRPSVARTRSPAPPTAVLDAMTSDDKLGFIVSRIEQLHSAVAAVDARVCGVQADVAGVQSAVDDNGAAVRRLADRVDMVQELAEAQLAEQLKAAERAAKSARGRRPSSPLSPTLEKPATLDQKMKSDDRCAQPNLLSAFQHNTYQQNVATFAALF